MLQDELQSGMDNGHIVQFYEGEPHLFERVGDFITRGLRDDGAAVLIATPEHRDGIEARLLTAGLDISAATTGGRYRALDAAQTLARFMVDGWPDARRFAEVVGSLIREARTPSGDRRVLAFGEMVALLWSEGKREAALRVEQLWNELALHEPFSLYCAYSLASFDDATYAKPFADIAQAHGWVIPGESYAITDIDRRNRVIAALQQKATALEAESRQRAVLETALRSKIDELAEIDRRKDEFLAMLGHELRNPLAPVTTALQIMRLHTGDQARVGRSREIIERQIEHMTRLIDDLLDVSRITRGKIELRRQAVALSAIVERAVETARPLIDARGHRLTLDLPTERVTLLADAARLEQVLANLLNNAAKYTDVGGRIRVTARAAGQEVTVSVEDNGPGLSPELRAHVFELFMQGPQTRTRARGGLGIGLTLVRRLVELHGGTVEAKSDGPGTGALFIIRMPLGSVKASAHGPVAKMPGAPAYGPRRRVLVVDDNVDAADALSELLRDYGHDVSTAHDGLVAIEHARLHRPEIVLLDISLPNMDGYEVARSLRNEVGLSEAVLVAVTGYGEERHRRLAREAGFDRHLTKPVDVRKLEELLELPL